MDLVTGLVTCANDAPTNDAVDWVADRRAPGCGWASLICPVFVEIPSCRRFARYSPCLVVSASVNLATPISANQSKMPSRSSASRMTRWKPPPRACSANKRSRAYCEVEFLVPPQRGQTIDQGSRPNVVNVFGKPWGKQSANKDIRSSPDSDSVLVATDRLRSANWSLRAPDAGSIYSLHRMFQRARAMLHTLTRLA
jgi:hypothetical protein